MYSPLETFLIFPQGMLNITLTNAIFYLFLAFLFVPFLFSCSMKRIIPTKLELISETLYSSVLNTVTNYVGNTVYFPLFFTLFILIFLSNLIGQVPYSYTPTTALIQTLAQGVFMLIGILIMGFMRHGSLLQGYFSPSGIPLGLMPLLVIIEILSFLTRSVALGLRQSVNLITGHVLTHVLAGFVLVLGSFFFMPIIVLIVFLGLEILISYLQAFIFMVICLITLKDIM